MPSVLVVAFALAAAAADAAPAPTVPPAATNVSELSVYCRLLQVGLAAAVYQPIIEDVNISVVETPPVLGAIDVSVSRAEIDYVRIVGCEASEDVHNVFDVRVTELDIGIKGLAWRFEQHRWPQLTDNGVAAGNTSASFRVAVDMAKERDHLFAFDLAELSLTTGAERHPWLTGALIKLLSVARPLVSAVVEHEARAVLEKSLGTIRTEGGCAFLQGALAAVDFATLSFTSEDPITQHVPLIGDVGISVNSTRVQQPTSMRCVHVGFNGSRLVAHIEEVAFSAAFDWAYSKNGSSFWHNNGTGVANVVGGALIQIDLLKPSATEMEVDLPALKVDLDAQYDEWLYEAISVVLVPLIRETLQLFGGRVLSYEIRKCLQDPTCPHLPGQLAHAEGIKDVLAPTTSPAQPTPSDVVII